MRYACIYISRTEEMRCWEHILRYYSETRRKRLNKTTIQMEMLETLCTTGTCQTLYRHANHFGDERKEHGYKETGVTAEYVSECNFLCSAGGNTCVTKFKLRCCDESVLSCLRDEDRITCSSLLTMTLTVDEMKICD